MGLNFLRISLMLTLQMLINKSAAQTTESTHSELHHENIQNRHLLTFPLEHGKFFSHCWKKIYGPEYISIFKGVTFHGGLSVRVKEGLTKYSKHIENREVQIDLEILDFLMFNFDEKEVLDFKLDPEPQDGKKETSMVRVSNPGYCMKRFNKRFSNHKKQSDYNEQYAANATDFCKQHLELFFPIDIHYSLNLKLTAGSEELVNKEPFMFHACNMAEFSKKIQHFDIKKIVEFAEAKAPTGDPKFNITQMDSILTTLENIPESTKLDRKLIQDNLPKETAR